MVEPTAEGPGKLVGVTMGGIEQWLKEGHLAPPCAPEVVANLSKTVGVALPRDYLHFLESHDGGEGFVGDNYLILWRAEDLAPFNVEYEVEQYAPGVLLFGSNGGGEAYGFDTRQDPMTVVRIPFIGMDLKYATPVADSFDSFLIGLEK